MLRRLLPLALLLLAAPARAQTPSTAPASLLTILSTGTVLDRLHGVVSQSLLYSAEKVDAFLGDKHLAEYSQNSQVRFSMNADVADRALNLNESVSARLALPRTTRRLHLVVDHFERRITDENNVPPDVQEVQDRVERGGQDPKGTFVGLRFAASTVRWFKNFIDLGVNARTDEPYLFPFSRTSVRASREWRKWVATLDNQANWQYETDVGAGSTLDFRRQWTPSLWSRAASQVLWRSDQFGVRFVESLSTSWLFTERDALTPTAQMLGHTHPTTALDAYTLSLSWRRRIYGTWVFAQATPEADFPVDQRFRRVYRLGLGLEARFGGD